MMRSTLLISAAILASLTYGCLQPMAQPQPMPVAGGKSCTLAIFKLKPGFSPADYGSCDGNQPCGFSPPEAYQIPAPPDDPGRLQIQAAFDAAPSFFKESLCRLDAIYIDTDPNTDGDKPLAWGLRERLVANLSGGPREVVGISTKELATLASAPQPLACYEQMNLRSILDYNNPATCGPPAPGQPWEYGVTFSASSDAPAVPPATRTAVATLSVLAHEVGHIRWFDTIIGPAGIAANSPRILSNLETAATDSFSRICWQVGRHQHGFHRFGQANAAAFSHCDPTALSVIKAQSGHDSCPICKAARLLNQVYQGDWGSLFASVAPDEDFVETYRLMVLFGPDGGGPVKDLGISIPNPNGDPYSENIAANFNKPGSPLAAKVKSAKASLGIR